MPKFTLRALPLVILLLLGVARPATAQDARAWEISAGYSFMHASSDHLDFFNGWAAGAGARVHDWLSIVVDASGHRKTLAFVDADIHLSTLTLMAGGRATAALGRFSEFAQVLVGVLRTSGTLFDATDTTTHLVWQPGLGLDYPLTARISFRGELDVRLIDTDRQPRAVLGVVFRAK